MESPGQFDAVVLAGGTGRRLAGADKGALVVGGRRLLDGVLLACAGARRTVVVGPERSTVVPVTWTVEEPPGGGPLAGLAAGVTALVGPAPVVLVLATDLARLAPRDVARLLAALAPGDDAAAFEDGEGRLQPLCAAYRRDPLVDALESLGPPSGLPVRVLLQRLTVRAVADRGASLDVDTPADLARERARPEETAMGDGDE